MPETGPKRGHSLARSSPWMGACSGSGAIWGESSVVQWGDRQTGSCGLLTCSPGQDFGTLPQDPQTGKEMSLKGSKQVTDSKCRALCPHSGCCMEAGGGRGRERPQGARAGRKRVAQVRHVRGGSALDGVGGTFPPTRNRSSPRWSHSDQRGPRGPRRRGEPASLLPSITVAPSPALGGPCKVPVSFSGIVCFSDLSGGGPAAPRPPRACPSLYFF